MPHPLKNSQNVRNQYYEKVTVRWWSLETIWSIIRERWRRFRTLNIWSARLIRLEGRWLQLPSVKSLVNSWSFAGGSNEGKIWWCRCGAAQPDVRVQVKNGENMSLRGQAGFLQQVYAASDRQEKGTREIVAYTRLETFIKLIMQVPVRNKHQGKCAREEWIKSIDIQEGTGRRKAKWRDLKFNRCTKN